MSTPVAHLVFCCASARRAFLDTELVWSDAVRGWILLTAPLRRNSSRQLWFTGEGTTENHEGEPYLWLCCPWCGGDLPYGHAGPLMAED